MYPKYLAALMLSLGLVQGGVALAAGEASRPPAKRAVSQGTEDLLARTVFQALFGEFAFQRGDVRLGSDAWTDLAQRTRDPKVLARATEVAGFASLYDRALELSQMWIDIEPDSAKARQAQSSLLVLANRIDELAPQLAVLLEQDKENLANNLLHLNRMLGRMNDKQAVQRLVDRLATPYSGMPEAHFAMAQAAANVGDNLRALNESEKALQLRPDWEAVAIARAQLQAAGAVGTAIDSLNRFVADYPKARDARLALARLLVADKRYGDARQQFERLLADNPDSPEVVYPVAMLALQQGDAKTGRAQLERLLETNFQDKPAVHFFLAQLDQEQGNDDGALTHYLQVAAGEQYVTARSRAALLLARSGKLDEA